MDIKIVTVVGGGTMGNGIAHVCALGGREVRITDVSLDVLDQALATISKNLDRQVKKEIISEAGRDEALERIRPMTDLEAAAAGGAADHRGRPRKGRDQVRSFSATRRDRLCRSDFGQQHVFHLDHRDCGGDGASRPGDWDALHESGSGDDAGRGNPRTGHE